MKFVVNSQYFAQELRLLDKIISQKAALPVLQNILFVADEKLSMVTTDLEVGLKTSCDADIVEGGIITLPSNKLLSIVEQLPNCDVAIYTDDKHVFLHAGMFKSRIQSIPAADFPTVPDVEGDITAAPLTTLQTLIARTRYTIADKGTKFTIDGALLAVNQDKAAMAATNGKSFSMSLMPWKTPSNMQIVIPSKTMDVIAAMVDQGDVEISASDNHLFFVVGKRTLYSRKMEAKFPSFQRIIPKDNDKIVDVNRTAFAAVIRRVGMMSEDKIQGIEMRLFNNLIVLKTQSADMGDAEEDLSVKYTGDNITVQFNWKYMLDFLDAAEGDTVRMALKNTEGSAVLMTDGEDFLNVISVMRY